MSADVEIDAQDVFYVLRSDATVCAGFTHKDRLGGVVAARLEEDQALREHAYWLCQAASGTLSDVCRPFNGGAVLQRGQHTWWLDGADDQVQAWAAMVGRAPGMAHRWQDAALSPARPWYWPKVAGLLADGDQLAMDITVDEVLGGPHVSQHGATSENVPDWISPDIVIAAAHASFVPEGITLDPCSSETAQRYVRAEKYWTTRGTMLPWEGNVWCYPPAGDTLYHGHKNVTAAFADKATREYLCGNVHAMIFSVPFMTTTSNYMHEPAGGVRGLHTAVAHSRERLDYRKPDGTFGDAPRGGMAFYYIGPYRELFTAAFAGFCDVYERV